ncbi:MAG: lytic murein transglycosylase [Alphaproteobacteria bacterium]|nr:lytic murein transglycosylase [Alphaproteobacteria bacterium]
MRSVIRLTFILACFAASPAPAADDEFSDFIAEVSREAAQKGVAAHHLRALAELTPDPEVLRLAARQPEYVKPIWAYLLQMVTPKRIALGRAQLAEREVFLGALEEKYGVPREILVAIWGVETNYGSNKGSHSVLQALATLGYTGKRADFGRQQLLSALQILQSGDVALQDFKGSWAGAMGHTQFIPTTYEGYAVDGSGDGVRDIWTEPEDALASSAHYLKRMGWRRDLDWGFEVRVPDDFDFSLAKLKQPKPAAFWRESGVQVLFSERRAREITDGLGDLSLFAPTGARGPMFLVTRNFRALLRYNSAPAYALAVAHLSERFIGAAPFVIAWPMADRPLLPKEIAAMQRGLLASGFDTGDVDGVLGSQTRAAVRAYQKARGLTVDGYATPGILTELQNAK